MWRTRKHLRNALIGSTTIRPHCGTPMTENWRAIKFYGSREWNPNEPQILLITWILTSLSEQTETELELELQLRCSIGGGLQFTQRPMSRGSFGSQRSRRPLERILPLCRLQIQMCWTSSLCTQFRCIKFSISWSRGISAGVIHRLQPDFLRCLR